jgi:hypothetical protein
LEFAIPKVILILSTLLTSWLGMMIVHEAGHAAVALLTGGKVQRIVLPVIGFSRTDVFPNPHPLAVAWGGAVLGDLIPALAFLIAAKLRRPPAYLLRFFTGFCFVANGAYIAAASFQQLGDAYPMILFGSKPWHLQLFGLTSLSLGLWLWNGLGPHFGLGPRGRDVKPSHATGMSILLGVIVLGELLVRIQVGSQG